jgi:hypothetical protein
MPGVPEGIASDVTFIRQQAFYVLRGHVTLDCYSIYRCGMAGCRLRRDVELLFEFVDVINSYIGYGEVMISKMVYPAFAATARSAAINGNFMSGICFTLKPGRICRP